jgi:hypothetical protein
LAYPALSSRPSVDSNSVSTAAQADTAPGAVHIRRWISPHDLNRPELHRHCESLTVSEAKALEERSGGLWPRVLGRPAACHVQLARLREARTPGQAVSPGRRCRDREAIGTRALALTLGQRGYSEEQIREMKPEDAHKTLGLISRCFSVDAGRGRGRVGSQPGGGLKPQSGYPDGSAFQNMILSK